MPHGTTPLMVMRHLWRSQGCERPRAHPGKRKRSPQGMAIFMAHSQSEFPRMWPWKSMLWVDFGGSKYRGTPIFGLTRIFQNAHGSHRAPKSFSLQSQSVKVHRHDVASTELLSALRGWAGCSRGWQLWSKPTTLAGGSSVVLLMPAVKNICYNCYTVCWICFDICFGMCMCCLGGSLETICFQALRPYLSLPNPKQLSSAPSECRLIVLHSCFFQQVCGHHSKLETCRMLYVCFLKYLTNIG